MHPEQSPTTSSAELDLSGQTTATTYITRGVMLGPQVALRLTTPIPRWTKVAASAQFFFLSNQVLDDVEVSSFQMGGIGISVCPVYGSLNKWLELGACTMARGAWLRAVGRGYSHAQTVSRSWWALGSEALASVRLQEHWGIELAAGFAVPLIMRQFNSGALPYTRDVGKTPIIAAQAGVGFAYRF
jgi:hypothetical protein